MDIIITVITIALVVFVISLGFVVFDYFNNFLQRKKREEYFNNLENTIYKALYKAFKDSND